MDKEINLTKPGKADLLISLYFVLGGFVLGLIVNFFSPNGIDMFIALGLK